MDPLSSADLNAQLSCIICAYHNNINADIVFGDAWLPKVANKKKIEVSLIITRT